MGKIKIAIIGIGNCASSLIQGIHYYSSKKPEEPIGLMHWTIGDYSPSDVEVVAAYDIDKRKVNQNLSQAIFSKPNCTKVFCPDIPESRVKVKMGRILDGIAQHMNEYDPERSFVLSSEPEADQESVVNDLRESGADIVVNYLPVGSEQAVKFYTECALEANTGFINNMPVFIASSPEWAKKFQDQGLPIIGDDIKSQIGATIIHRTLADLFAKRGVKLERTYQLNTGGNTDFLNMIDQSRLRDKRISKTNAVKSVLNRSIENHNIHIGPSDYIPWLEDNKLCFLRMEGKVFGDIPMEIELRLSVEDSPNSAGVVIDAIRCCKLAKDRGLAGVLQAPSAFFMKHPPQQYPDNKAYQMLENFISENSQE